MRIQALLLATFVSAVMADTPPPAQSAKETANAEATAQPTATKETAAKPKKVKAELDPYTADLGDLQTAGYTIKKQNGETLYCRKDPETGSRVKKNTFCLTAEQLRQIQQNTRDGMREMTRQAGATER